MNIHDYLKDSTLVREELFNYRLLYELKMAAAERLYHLKTFKSTVDIEGFDIMLDDNNKVCRLQLKSRYNASTRVLKEIHSVMLLPNRYDANLLRFNNGLCPSHDNGIVLIDVSHKPELQEPIVQYYYLDFYLLFAISKGLITWKKRQVQKADEILRIILTTKVKNERIKIPLGLMVKIRDTSSLLAICGLDSSKDVTHRRAFMKIFAKNTNRAIDNNGVIVACKNMYVNILSSLVKE